VQLPCAPQEKRRRRKTKTEQKEKIRMKTTVFIDGQHGTTGLKIHERLLGRDEIGLIEIPVSQKKDIKKKEQMLNDADVVFLCLPDDAARESVSLIVNEKVKVLDPSTAHRTSREWVYGIPELKNGQREEIEKSKRVSVPGCHATGFVMCMHPLISEGILSPDYPANCYSISGYSGGGQKYDK
jgi:N-acetyl-gamma-glutamyl-phosphate reductase